MYKICKVSKINAQNCLKRVVSNSSLTSYTAREQRLLWHALKHFGSCCRVSCTLHALPKVKNLVSNWYGKTDAIVTVYTSAEEASGSEIQIW